MPLCNLGRPRIDSREGSTLYICPDMLRIELEVEVIITNRSVTMSNTAPNFDDWPNALAACPSAASSKQDIQYASVQYLGW